MSKEQINVPDIGGAEGAELIEFLVAVGDDVTLDQPLIVLESDKASMEIPSTMSGTVVELLAAVGDELSEGAAILAVETTGESTETESVPAVEAAPEPAMAVVATEEPAAAVQDDASAEASVVVPDIGTDEAVELIEISVAVGDTVAEGDSLVVLESDKASMEVPAPFGGTVQAITVNEGDQVSQGDQLMVFLSSPGTAQAEAVVPESAVAPVAKASAASAPPAAKPAAAVGNATQSSAEGVYAGPAVRKLAREFGVELDRVSGSGPRGRVVKEDLHQYVQQTLKTGGPAAGGGSAIPAIPDIDFTTFGEVELVSRSKIDKVTAANMQRNWLNVPHVTQFDDADITELELFRKGLKAEAESRGTRLTPMPFLLKALAVALRDNPKMNASLSSDGESLVYKKYINLGMAVDTPAGLMVPVIRDVDKKTLWELAEEVLTMAAKARDRKLMPADMQGGCFTISSLGNIGGRGFTPIVNAPEVGILGVSKATVQPVWDGQEFKPRNMLPLALSYDHRVINGGDGGRFLGQMVALLGDIRHLLL